VLGIPAETAGMLVVFPGEVDIDVLQGEGIEDHDLVRQPGDLPGATF
jgi:hypothetical protein